MSLTMPKRVLLNALLWFGWAVSLGSSSVSAAPGGSPWGANYFPNVELVTQDGKKVRFYDDLIKDKVFAINFIYTECKDSCPMETAALRNVQKALGDRMGRDVFFYSISLDAGRDNPKVLKAYAEKYHAGPGWMFLSGRKADVNKITHILGMDRKDGVVSKTVQDHNINILMGNEKGGQWIKRSPFDETAALVRILGARMQSGRTLPANGLVKPAVAPEVDAARAASVSSGTAQPQAEAPTVASTEVLDPTKESAGEKLFYDRCYNCHRMETAEADDIGPGLAGVVQRRDRNWLKRWIKAPDALLEAKDPLALQLFKQYNGVYMPNIRLTDAEVEAVIQYMEGVRTPLPPISAVSH